jgi:biofilm PGA synthesis N-glycosyltransferase PgaC
MVILLGITAFIILLYLAYPLWLATIPSAKTGEAPGGSLVESVTLVYLSYNGHQYLEEKITALLKELYVFKDFEMIIIDDHSDDGSVEILNKFKGQRNVHLILKAQRTGIPDSMNLAVAMAGYEHIIFCDQRQELSENILPRLLRALESSETGAVSACISEHDKSHCCSRIRSYENYVKCLESRAGSLIGVYGPLYAIKKSCYFPIPNNIILDDLYLSLKILAGKQVRIMKECLITDEKPSVLYNYQRAKRYVRGFIQIAKSKGLFSELSRQQVIMLIWHKYLRLFIPVLLVASYVSAGIASISDEAYRVPFIAATALFLLLSLPARIKIHARLKNLARINFFYFFAIFEVGFHHFFLRKGTSDT